MGQKIAIKPHRKVQQQKSDTSFLFVHQTSDKFTRGRNGYQVNAHVQVLFRQRKSGVAERWKPVTSSSTTQVRLKLKHKEIKIVQSRQYQRRQSKIPTPWSGGWAQSTSQGLASPLQKGNSDPFQSMPITIQPVVNMILSWHYTIGIPALSPVETAVLPAPSPSMVRIWRDAVSSVQHPSLIYPYLASVCALMGRRTGDEQIKRLALQLKDRGYAKLRTVLETADTTSTVVTRGMIYNMFWAELAGGRPVAARTHLKMLYRLIRTSGFISEIPSECRLKFLTADTNLAVWQMWSPVSMPEDVCIEHRFADWKDHLSLGIAMQLDSRAKNLHRSITNDRLRVVLVRLRELVSVADLVAKGICRDSSIFQWMDARVLWCESTLVSFCAGSVRNTDSEETNMKNRTEYCTALAALCWIASTWASSNRGVAPAMVKMLRSAMEDALSLAIDHQSQSPNNLWITYAGASTEYEYFAKQPLGDWFTERLANVVKLFGLAEVTKTLTSFIFMPAFGPLSSA